MTTNEAVATIKKARAEGVILPDEESVKVAWGLAARTALTTGRLLFKAGAKGAGKSLLKGGYRATSRAARTAARAAKNTTPLYKRVGGSIYHSNRANFAKGHMAKAKGLNLQASRLRTAGNTTKAQALEGRAADISNRWSKTNNLYKNSTNAKFNKYYDKAKGRTPRQTAGSSAGAAVTAPMVGASWANVGKNDELASEYAQFAANARQTPNNPEIARLISAHNY